MSLGALIVPALALLTFQVEQDVLGESAWPLEELHAARRLTDPLAAARAESEVLYRGREFASARSAAEVGLALAPDDLRLLQLATSSSLWLQDARTTRVDLELWRTAIARANERVPTTWWNERLGECETQLGALEASEHAVDRCKTRAQTICLVLLGSCALVGTWIACTSGRPYRPNLGEQSYR
jgi:hypothetical protein